MEFGKDLRRRFGRVRGADALAGDAAVLELLPIALLRTEARAAEAATVGATGRDRGRRCLDHAMILREIGRRTGEPETLVKAASTAERAGQEAAGDMALFAAARLEQALAALTTADLFGMDSVADAANGWFAEAAEGLSAHPSLKGRVAIAGARFTGRRALMAGDLDDAVNAAGAYDDAVGLLDAEVRRTGLGHAEAAAARCERAELLIGFGARLKDRKLLEQAQSDMRQLTNRLDPDYLPLSWARAASLRGAALAALGDLNGDAQSISSGVEALTAACETAPLDHSPLDHARALHGLGLARQALGEATDDEGLFDIAVEDMDIALTVLDSQPALRLRPIAAYDRAACMARRAERLEEPLALAKAEKAFRAELQGRRAESDPVSWAVLQVALARVYEARAELLGDAGDRADAACALTEAMEVFTDRGLKSLAEAVGESLERLRGPIAEA